LNILNIYTHTHAYFKLTYVYIHYKQISPDLYYASILGDL